MMSNSSLRLTAEVAGLAAADQKAPDVAVGIERALGDRDQRAGAAAAPWGTTTRHSMPLLLGMRLKPGGTGIGCAARQQAVLAVVEAHDLVHALERRHRAMPPSSASDLGVVPAARGDRPPVAARASAPSRHRRCRPAVRRDRRCGRAASGPCRSRRGNRAVRRARGWRRGRRIPCAATTVRGRRGTSSAPKRRRAGSRASKLSIGLARISILTRTRSRRRAAQRARRPARTARRQPEAECDRRIVRQRPRRATVRVHACSLPRAGGSARPAAFSSNSSASFSVIAPPSSSASTMVTARR